MKFEEALVELRKGKEIICISKGGLTLKLDKNSEIKMSSFLEVLDIGIMELIIKGEWIIEYERGKSFPDVFEAFKEGKRIRRKSWIEIIWLSTCSNFEINNKDLLSIDWEIID